MAVSGKAATECLGCNLLGASTPIGRCSRYANPQAFRRKKRFMCPSAGHLIAAETSSSKKRVGQQKGHKKKHS